MKPKALGAGVPIGGNIPILGKKKPKAIRLKAVTPEQLEQFLFDIAFGYCEGMTALEMKLEMVAEEHGIDLTLEEGEYREKFEANLPKVMAAFGFGEPPKDDQQPKE